MARRLAFVLVFLLVVAAAGAAALSAWGYAQFVRPGPSQASTIVVIPKGAGVEDIAKILLRTGVIVDPLVFRLGVRFLGADGALRAGEFEFPAKASPKQAMIVLQRGKTVVRRLTVAEGLTTAEILDLIAKTEGLSGDIGDPPEEGSLLPETYYFSYGDDRGQLIRRMADAMAKTLAELWDRRAPNLPLKSAREALILASIVEKETGLAEERPRIAGVFVNRLTKGMRLQSDPTVAYGITLGGPGLDRPLTRADLERPTAYNTYTSYGLPPGPICNPGRAAIDAVVQPAATPDLYFVADGSGGHAFARSLAEHNLNVANWRKIERARKRQAQ